MMDLAKFADTMTPWCAGRIPTSYRRKELCGSLDPRRRTDFSTDKASSPAPSYIL